MRDRFGDGKLIAKTEASILPKVIVVLDVSLPINVGDEVRRRLPNGQDEAFEVLDPKFFEKFHDLPPHFKLEYRRKGQFAHGAGGNYTISVQGANARVDIASRDQSTNIVTGDIFGDLTAALKANVSDPDQLAKLIASIDDMRANQGQSGMSAAYQRFISLCADHMGIIVPFLPALTALLPS